MASPALFALDSSLSIRDDRYDDMPDIPASSALGEDIGSHAQFTFLLVPIERVPVVSRATRFYFK